jgi:hypothetical protein
LPVALEITREATGSGRLRLGYVYQEPDGSEVRSDDEMVAGEEGRTLRYDDLDWAVVEKEPTKALGELKVVLEAKGDDNRKPATVRLTIAAGDEALTLTKAVRYNEPGSEFFVRNTYRLKRKTP